MDRVDTLLMENSIKKDNLADMFDLYKNIFFKSCEKIRQSGIPVKGELVKNLGKFQCFELLGVLFWGEYLNLRL